MGGYSNRGVGSAFHKKKVENKPPGGGNEGVVFPTGTPEFLDGKMSMLMLRSTRNHRQIWHPHWTMSILVSRIVEVSMSKITL